MRIAVIGTGYVDLTTGGCQGEAQSCGEQTVVPVVEAEGGVGQDGVVRQNPHTGGKYDPVISVITAVKNGMPYLPDLLNSVEHQDYPHVEHIVIDDGSTDGGRRVRFWKMPSISNGGAGQTAGRFRPRTKGCWLQPVTWLALSARMICTATRVCFRRLLRRGAQAFTSCMGTRSTLGRTAEGCLISCRHQDPLNRAICLRSVYSSIVLCLWSANSC